MQQLYPDLWKTAEQKQFSTLTVHAYLLKRADGNVLFYNPRSTADCPRMADLGGVAYHCLSHCHEVGPQLGSIAERFESELCCHARVESYLSVATRADVCFRTPPREVHAGDIEVIHTPGHTDNNVCYRYASPHGRAYLFTGDTLYLHEGQWRTLVVGSDGGNHRDLARSLERLRGLAVDVIVCSVAVGPMQIIEVTPGEWRRLIDGLLGPLQHG